MRPVLRPPCLPLILACAGLACRPSASPGPGEDTAVVEPSPSLGSLSVELDARVPTVARATWTSDQPGQGRLGWRPEDDELWRATAWQDPAGATHSAELAGLVAGARAVLRPELLLEDGQVLTGEEVEVVPSGLPAGVSAFEVTVDALDEDDDLLLLTNLMGGARDVPLVINRRGDPVWFTVPESEDRILSTSISADGASVWFAQNPTDYEDIVGRSSRISLDGRELDTVDLERLHSGVAELPDGGFGFILKQDIAFGGGRLLYDEIWEYQDGEARQIFSIYDHFEPGPLCSCWDDLVFEGATEPYYDWTHANSLVLSEDGEAWYFGLRNFDTVLKVYRASGELVWALGGPYSDFTFSDGDSGWQHGHFSQMRDDRLLIFDNGTHRSPPRSRVAEYQIDQEARTATLLWEYSGQTETFVPLLGDAKRLSDDEVVVSWTTAGLLERVDNAGNLRWQAATGLGTGVGRVAPIQTLSP